MATARDIVSSALRKIHVLGKGASLDPDEANDALDTLNDMIATWSAQGDLIFTETSETFPLSAQNSFTIGSGGDFNTTRPLYFRSVIVSQGDIDYTLREYDNQRYASIIQKDIGNIPQIYYYDANFPLARIYLYPIPTSVSTITLYSFKELTSFTSLDTTFVMPPEYKAALIYNLAVWIAPEYEREASRSVVAVAKRTKNAVMTQNKRNEQHVSDIDVPQRGDQHGNIYAGYYT